MKRILVIGEQCVDKFVYCNAKRLSPEAPVPVLNPIKTTKNQGMAGNTLANVRALVPDYYTMFFFFIIGYLCCAHLCHSEKAS